MVKIYIPDSCEHTQALRVLVDPAPTNGQIQLFDGKTEKPFQDGKIENRICPEIAVFMFRSKQLVEENGKIIPVEHLTKGEKIRCVVTVTDENGKPVIKEQTVEVL